MAPRLAFIGMGLMGQAMTKNLVLHGNLDTPLTIYNRTKKSAEEHSAIIGHSIIVDSIEEVVLGSDVIWSCLQDEKAVEDTYKSILTKDINGKLFIESSTITPESTNSIAKQVLSAGGEFVALPVMGEPSMAERQMLICIAAGSPESVERIKPYIVGVVGHSLVDLSGEEPGKASLLKIMGNVLIISTMETVAEVNVFAEKCGLGMQNMEKLMGQMFPRPPHAIYNQRMMNGDYYKNTPMVEVSKARSLTSHVLDLAKSAGASVKAYEVAVEHLKVVETHVGSKADILGIYGAVRLESGLPYENGSQ
ncbi:6-phosphogluconate dehydrogenase-like protein [Bisporella sp. PMI_857]|nr:6-phosphogluconate dehydrogenase-like protein [Bisporella sp. PMI_857]